MAFKTILLNLNETERNGALIEQAANLARAMDAHIAGHYVIPAVQVYPSTAFEAMPVIFEAHREFFSKQQGQVKSSFLEALRRHGVQGDMAVVDSPSPLICDSVIEHGRVSDLVLVSQVDTSGNQGVELDFVDRVVIEVGRPVLVMPLQAKPVERIGTAIVAWNGRREAARAAFDSLPLLRQAKEVRVVRVDPQRDDEGPTTLAGSELAETLARHGINATVEPISSNGQEAGLALLTKVFDVGADLLVMGAYGHSRAREFILGGATRQMLKNMRSLVLFSH
ncbi:MAG: universal stress protein [Rhizobiales bacterium]|nr:universal stress protein [Hyphomicrobiales bacterium]